MPNSAHIYQSKSGNYYASFHHPICREGSIGKKIHRSLKVTEKSQAQILKLQIDDLLAIAAETPSLLPTRSRAISDRKYARVVIDAFFDCMSPEPIDYLALRDRAMPMPPRTGKKGSVPRVVIVGATGVGKSRFTQHLLQTTSFNFPMRGAGRTTVSDTEVIVDDVDYSAAITFFSENEIRQIVKENIVEACAFASKDKDNAKIASKLLVDSDKRFRFNFVLGNWSRDNEDDDDDLESGEQDNIFDASVTSAALPWMKLQHCVDQIIFMTEVAIGKAREIHPESSPDASGLDEWLQHIDQEQVDTLAEEILEELERRLCWATGETSWPVIHRIPNTSEKAEFFRLLQRFHQNNRKLFGVLVTPLVQGIRVQGRFSPPAWAAEGSSAWVLLDGQGVGHEQVQATSIDRTIPPELAKKFSGADVICLVDRAVPAMIGDAPVLLEHLLTRGYLDRLILVFTHFEAVNAPDLDTRARKEKVLEGLSNAIQSIASLPKAQRVLLEGQAETKAHFLSDLDSQELKIKSTRQDFARVCSFIKNSIAETEVRRIRPMYNEYEIADILSREIQIYRRDWSEAALSRWNYKIIEALANWIGNAYSDGYPKRGLYPGQNLSERLVSKISIELEKPKKWDPSEPDSKDQSTILNAIRNKVGERIDAYCRDVLVQDPRTNSWLPAYQNISGQGTKVRRARTVARILEDRAQLPNEGLGKFTKDIWDIVEKVIVEVCSPNAGGES